MTALEGSIAVIHDMPEEGWPSMDQMGHLLTSRLPALAPGFTVTPVRHRMTRSSPPVPAASTPAVLGRSGRSTGWCSIRGS